MACREYWKYSTWRINWRFSRTI